MCLDRKLAISFVYPKCISGHQQCSACQWKDFIQLPRNGNRFFLSGCNILIDDKYIYVLNYIRRLLVQTQAHGPNTSASAQYDNTRGAWLTQEGCTIMERKEGEARW